MSKQEEYVSFVMMRELMNIQKETILSFFRETVTNFNLQIESFQKNVQDLRNDLNEIKVGMNFVGDIFDDKVKAFDEKIKKVTEEIINVKKIQGKISSDNSDLKLKSVDIEDRNRRSNLRIDGLVESSDEKEWEVTKTKVKKLFAEKLEIDREIKIERAHRVGKDYPGRERTVVLKLHDFEDKKVIMEKVSKLKGTNVFINEDFSEATRKVRKELFAQAKTHRQNGYFAKVVYNKLIVREFKKDKWNGSENLKIV